MTNKNIEQKVKNLEEKVATLTEFHDFKYKKGRRIFVSLKDKLNMELGEKFSKYLFNTKDFPYEVLLYGCVEIPERAFRIIKSNGYDIMVVDYKNLINDKKFAHSYCESIDKYLGLDVDS